VGPKANRDNRWPTGSQVSGATAVRVLRAIAVGMSAQIWVAIGDFLGSVESPHYM
jgi:hypothetical protein